MNKPDQFNTSLDESPSTLLVSRDAIAVELNRLDVCGDEAAGAAPGVTDLPNWFASALKSSALTLPSRLKSPCSKLAPTLPKCWAIAVKSSVSTLPSWFASPAIE